MNTQKNVVDVDIEINASTQDEQIIVTPENVASSPIVERRRQVMDALSECLAGFNIKLRSFELQAYNKKMGENKIEEIEGGDFKCDICGRKFSVVVTKIIAK